MSASTNASFDFAMRLRQMLHRSVIIGACLLAVAAWVPSAWAQIDTPTDTETPADTPTETATAADTATDTPAPADTPTETATPADTVTDTPVPADTPTETVAPADTDTPTPVDTPTDTPVIPADTPTDTPVVPADTPTDTPVIPADTPTDTPVIPADTPTDTPAIPVDTPTDTPVISATPTDTPADTPTDTPLVPVATATDTPVAPASTATDTPVVPASTPTDTVPPTNTPLPTSTPPPTNTLPPTRTYTPTVLPLEGSSDTIRPLVQAQCAGGMCNQLGLTFSKGRVRLQLVRQANAIGDREVGEIKLKRVFRPQPELRAQVVGDVAYGADPDGDCPLANTQALGALYATSTLTCETKRGASNCKGVLVLPAFTASACTDVDVVVTNVHIAVYDIVAPGAVSSLIARDGIKIRAH